MNIQTIKAPGGDMVVLPRKDFDALVAALEDKRDIETASAILARIEAGNEETFPAEVANALLAGKNSIKVFREHRHMTQSELAKKAKMSPVYLSQIERGARNGGEATLSALAKALCVPIELLS